MVESKRLERIPLKETLMKRKWYSYTDILISDKVELKTRRATEEDYFIVIKVLVYWRISQFQIHMPTVT